MRPLSKELQEKATNELNEDPLRVEEDIKHLKEWLAKQPHLISRQDDHFLMCFLRGCKFSLQKAKEKLDYFYTTRVMLPEYFNCRDPFSADVQRILNSGFILPLSQPVGPAGGRVILFRWNGMDPATMPLPVLAKVMYMMIDVLMKEDDHTIVAGIYLLLDYKNFPIGYTLQFTPTALHKSCIGIQSSYPLRLKGMDFVNVPGFFDKLYTIIKPILTKKVRGRSNVYTDMAPSLYDRIPQSILPKEYGGLEETIAEIKDKWKKKIESYAQWFKEDEKYYCNEELRPEGSKNDIFGVDGAFRKLDID